MLSLLRFVKQIPPRATMEPLVTIVGATGTGKSKVRQYLFLSF